MNPNEIRSTLDEESVRLSKALGQNLLHDQMSCAASLRPPICTLPITHWRSAPALARSRNIY